MAPKKKNKGRGRRSKTPGQTSASHPNPTVTSPSASVPTRGATTTTSLVPSSSFTSAPPTTTTTTQVIPSAPPQPTFLPSSSTSQITTTQPLPSAPPEPIQQTHQERISCTSDGATATDLASPSTAPSALAVSTRTPKLLPITDDFMSLFAPALAAAMAAVKGVKKQETADVQEMVVGLLGLKIDDMESVLGTLQGLAEKMEGEVELKMASEALENMEVIKRAVAAAEMLLAERRNRNGSGGSCGGSEGKGGGPDSGTGEGDGEGGGVSV